MFFVLSYSSFVRQLGNLKIFSMLGNTLNKIEAFPYFNFVNLCFTIKVSICLAFKMHLRKFAHHIILHNFIILHIYGHMLPIFYLFNHH